MPTSQVIATWRSLPATCDEDVSRAKCFEAQEFAIDWRRWLFAVGTIATGGGIEPALACDNCSAGSVILELTVPSHRAEAARARTQDEEK